MGNATCIPNSKRQAGLMVRRVSFRDLKTVSKPEFLSAWSAIAYLFPGLHPDEFENPEGGWPRSIRKFAVEAWRRFDAGHLCDEELYNSDACWSGLYDQMKVHTQTEMDRRFEIASENGMNRCSNLEQDTQKAKR